MPANAHYFSPTKAGLLGTEKYVFAVRTVAEEEAQSHMGCSHAAYLNLISPAVAAIATVSP
ncbi:hypothetical protein CVCC1112_3373 [Paenarthrobacter nicotinovorans]|nr:hypothetical protein CVCC1112_3373 [Paenarthrobacter nicotinovorans]